MPVLVAGTVSSGDPESSHHDERDRSRYHDALEPYPEQTLRPRHQTRRQHGVHLPDPAREQSDGDSTKGQDNVRGEVLDYVKQRNWREQEFLVNTISERRRNSDNERAAADKDGGA